VLRRCVEALGWWVACRRALDDGIRRMPILACRGPACGRRCWDGGVFVALLVSLEGVLLRLAITPCRHNYSHTYLGACLEGLGTGMPASIDDCNEVGGFVTGICVGWPVTAKS